MALDPEEYVKCIEFKSPEQIKIIYKKWLACSNSSDHHVRKASQDKINCMEKHFTYLGDSKKRSVEPTKPAKSWEAKVAYKYVQLHKSAERRGKEFNLTLRDVANLLVTSRCYYTGVTLSSVHDHIHQRTVDRIDNTKGYVKGNVVACAHIVNQIKNELFENQQSELLTSVDMIDKLVSKLKETN